jgi:hypothetical protein
MSAKFYYIFKKKSSIFLNINTKMESGNVKNKAFPEANYYRRYQVKYFVEKCGKYRLLDINQ